MDAKALIAILLVAAVAVAVVLFLRQTRHKHPEQTATHQRPDQGEQAATPSIGRQGYPGTDRPAGPDAEAMTTEVDAAHRPGTTRPRR